MKRILEEKYIQTDVEAKKLERSSTSNRKHTCGIK